MTVNEDIVARLIPVTGRNGRAVSSGVPQTLKSMVHYRLLQQFGWQAKAGHSAAHVEIVGEWYPAKRTLFENFMAAYQGRLGITFTIAFGEDDDESARNGSSKTIVSGETGHAANGMVIQSLLQ